MSIEDAINNLASAVDRSEPSVAVREIIRQRDDALNNLAADKRRHESTRVFSDTYWKQKNHYKRQVAALKGVITKMRKAGEKP